MKFPYGICDFYDVITENYFYVDRTDKISLIEKTGKYPLFLRPRRFGKSLILSMLENYYDVAKAKQFELLFGHLAIGKNPTNKHNQYFVMNWDFSAVDSSGSAEDIRQRLHDHINGCIEHFKAHYKDFLTNDIELHPTNAIRSLQSVLAALQSTSYKLYLLIDEYDNFANEVMMAGKSDSRDRYETLIQGEGALKAVFKAVKTGTKGLGIDRIFITGVSPVVMSDISSGFNIAENIYLTLKFNDLCGFWETEILTALQQIAEECQLEEQQIHETLAMMRTFYDGYCFFYTEKSKLYNPTLALYFLKHLQDTCQYPRQILDDNLAMDRGKIIYISQLPHGETVISAALNEKEPLAIAQLASRFGVNDMLTATKDTPFMVSLLYYFGILTFDGDTPSGELIFRIPNLVMRKLYVEQLQDLFLPDWTAREEVRHITQQFYRTGDLQPLCQFMVKNYFKAFSNRDYRWTNELTVKTAFLTLLFNDTFYIMDSEPELNRQYADLTMIIRPDMRRYQLLDFLIEFKYVKFKEIGLSAEQVKQLSDDDLAAKEIVKEKLAESKKQLKSYRQTLQSRHDNQLRLHCYSVVAVGYERLITRKYNEF
ncbi:AAA family ATPase [Candidatus Parabeggiatoa sp. HSG14]|uniref:AAA family ATPase n=1 Tax=Candidatus Parabeggiatoa sp. HSG14 TaxID=3055593 RepID=UPI0025A927CF|nr:AAA family ATPase [Thiotrichales bacterium HSG14]